MNSSTNIQRSDALEQIEIGNETIIEKIRNGKLQGNKIIKKLYSLIAISLSGFTLYNAAFGLLESWKYRMIHLTLILALVFLGEIILSENKKAGILNKILGYGMLAMLIALAIYSSVDYENIILRIGIPNFTDVLFGIFLIILVLVAGQRRLGWGIAILGSFFIFYALFGYLFPGNFYHRGMSYFRFIDFLFNQTRGILGIPIKISADYVIMFLIFVAFLTKSGAGKFFIKLAFALTGKMWGGPAKAAVIASAMMATINGSGIGNVMATGSITIPLMIKVGYKRHFAGGVEAAASTGGMITPPIMGAVAFLIAEFTGIPYFKIMIHAVIPAFLYFSAVFLMVHFEAKRTNLLPMDDKDIPDIRQVLKEGWYYIVPIFVLASMLIRGYSAMLAALIGIILTVALSYLKKETRMSLWDILASMEEGASNTVVVAAACAVAGIVVGTIAGTGLGIKFTSIILSVANNNLFIVLILAMISCIILGMGMTASAVYIIVSALTVQSLISMGVLEIPAHFFVFYYGIASAITPPVALASYGAAGIAGANQVKTSLAAIKLASVAFIVPFAFVYNPALLAIGTLPKILLSVITAFVGVVALSSGFSRWLLTRLNRAQQLILIVAGVGLITDLFWVNVIALSIFIVILIQQFMDSKKEVKITS